MARLTWTNVAAPDISSSAAAMAQAGRAFQNAFTGFGDVARSIGSDRNDAASNAELARLAQVGSADQVDAYLQGLSGRINPNQMNTQLMNAVRGLRQGAQGYDTTSLNQDNTRSVIGQRAEDAQYKRDLTQQSAALNADMNEAYRLQEAGDYTKADAIIQRTLAQNPIAASQTDIGNLNQNLRTIQSAPNAAQFTTEGRAEADAETPVINNAVQNGFDATSVGDIAYKDAIARGLSETAAARLSAKAVTAFGSIGTSGSDGQTPIGNTGAVSAPVSGNVDRVLGAITAPPPALETTVPAPSTPQTLGGIPVAVPDVTGGASAVDAIVAPTAPATPADVPVPEMVPTTVASTGTGRIDTTNPDSIREGLDVDPTGTMTSLKAEQRQFVDALNIQGSDAGQMAYDLFIKGSGGLDVEEGKLLGSLPEGDKAEGKRLLDSAIIKVSRNARVSPEAAKAAILATLDPTNWYGALSSPTADVSAATDIARQLQNPEQRDEFSKKSQELTDIRSQIETVNNAIDTDMATLSSLQNSPPRSLTPAAREKGIETVKARIAKNAAKLAKTMNAGRSTRGLERPEPRSTAAPSTGSVPTAASGLGIDASVNAAAPAQIAEAVKPALVAAGMTGAQVNANERSIEADVNRLVSTTQKTTRTLNQVNTAISNLVDQYVQDSSPAVIAQMSPEEIQDAAMNQDNAARPYGDMRDSAVWGNIQKALPNTKEFEKYKKMSPSELRKIAPELLPTLQTKADETNIPISEVVQKIVEKYKNK